MNRFVTTCDVCGCDCNGNYYLIQKYPININYFTGTESNKRDICESCYKMDSMGIIFAITTLKNGCMLRKCLRDMRDMFGGKKND